MRIKTVMAAVRSAACAWIVACGLSAAAASYSVSGNTGSFGKVSLPSSFSGTVSSAVGSSTGYYDTFTFTPNKGGKQKVSVSVSKQYGANHTIKTIIYKGTVSQLAAISGSGSATVSLTAGQYYTVKVQMISPSSYTTTTYSYKVTVGSSSSSSSSSSTSSTPTVPTPSASKGTYAGYVKVSWSKVSGATGGYYVMRGTSSTYSKATLLKQVGASTTSLNDSSAAAGKTYYYWVCPIKGSKYYYNTSKYASGYRKSTSNSSSSTSSTPTVPTPSASKGTYADYVKISWSKVSGATGGYYVMRGTSSTYSKASLLKQCASTTTALLDYSAAAGKTYYYWVCPIKGSKYYYNASKYASGYRKKGSSSSSSSSSTSTAGSISGPSSLNKNQTGYYYLYVGGKKITANAVAWKKSGSYGTVYDSGYYGRLYAGNPAKSGVTTKITATYNGKTYSKTVKLYK